MNQFSKMCRFCKIKIILHYDMAYRTKIIVTFTLSTVLLGNIYFYMTYVMFVFLHFCEGRKVENRKKK